MPKSSPDELSIGPTRRTVMIGSGLALLLPPAVAGAAPSKLGETPYFATKVKGGRLPAVAARVPLEPAVVSGTAGKPGGTLHMLMGSPHDTRQMVVSRPTPKTGGCSRSLCARG
jgi:hypothetical protein